MPTTSRGYPSPTTGDDNNPPADIQALAEAVNADMNAQYAPIATPTVASASAPPDGTRIIRKIGYVQATTSASGVVAVTFGTPFPNGALHAPAVTTSGASLNPVINGGVINKAGVNYIFPGINNTAVKFTYEAIGW